MRTHPLRPFRIRSVSVLMLIAALLLTSACARREGAATVTISNVFPGGETTRFTNILIEFSKAVMSQDSVDVLFDSAPVEFTPALEGRFRWIDTHTLKFLPTEPLQPATDYTLRVRPQITERSGLTLRGPTEYRFHTQYLKVTQLLNMIERLPEDPTQTIFFFTAEFNEEVDPGELFRHLNVRVSTPAGARDLSCSVTTAAPATQIEIQSDPITLGEEDGSVRLNISPGLNAVGGSVPMREAYNREFSFLGSEELKVESVRPEQRGNVYAIMIRFSSTVDPELARRFITLEPQMDFTIAEVGRSLRLSGNLRAGRTVTVRVEAGLMAKDGARLERDFNQPVLMGDLSPSVNFSSPGSYLSRQGLKNVGIEVVNMTGLQLEVEKVYRNNLVHYLQAGTRWYSPIENLGRRIWETETPLSLTRNETHTVTVNFEEFLDEHPAGLFRLRVRAQDRYWRSDAKSVLLTDIGMIGKRTDDELYVWTLSTSTLEPLAGLDITLMSVNNQVMGTARTDGNGAALIGGLSRHEGEFEPYLVTADRGEEFSYLLFEECEVATADFDVDGRPTLLNGYEAFIYGERGVYRPGETARMACIIRAPGRAVPPSFPVRLKVIRPDGRTLLEKQARTQESGAVEFDAEIPTYAQTGRYQTQLFGPSEDPIGTMEFSVEEFIPDRIKVEVETDQESYRTGETVRATVTGTMLFGPPAAGRRMDAMMRIEPAPFAPSGFTTYTFGDPETEFTEYTQATDGGELDPSGRGDVELEIPSTLKPPAALRAILQATVHESGGRAVSSYTTFDVHAYPFYIGLRREEEGYAQIDRPETFTFVTLEPGAATVGAGTLTARFSRLRWRSILTRDTNGRYRYVSQKTEEVLETIRVPASEGEGDFNFTPTQWGQYRVTLFDPESGSSTAITFYASGWGYAPWSLEKPGQVDLEFDRELYSSGDEAHVLVKAPFTGKLLLTVEREKILMARLIDLGENTADIPLRVRPDYLPNAYVTATLVRSSDSADPQAPMRAYGTVPLMVDCTGHELGVAIEAPGESRPKRSIDVEVRLTEGGGATAPPQETAHVTIAAVDEGILQLTSFQTPNPMDFFYGKKRLEVSTYDLFALLMPELEQSEIFSAPAGDRMEMMRLEHLTPVTARRVKAVSLWSGLLPVDREGRVRTTFELPEFNGTLRVMAVASAGSRFGTAWEDMRVRDPIVITPTFPRFVSTNDVFQVPVNVFNGTGREGSFRLSIEVEGPAEIVGEATREVTVGDDTEIPANFIVRADNAAGILRFTVNAEGNSESTSVEVEVPLRPPSPRESRTGSGAIAPGGETTVRLPSRWLPGTARYKLTVTPFPAVEFSGGLQMLLRYPYGCVEQTTSAAFPLLYFKDLARQVEPELFETNAPEYFVEEAIQKLSGMQHMDGGFSFWPNSGRVHDWGSVYAMHFLVEAGRAGYTVPDQVLRRGARYLRGILFTRSQPLSRLSSQQTSRWAARQLLRTQTYAAYVLALMGDPARGAMTFILESMESELTLESRLLLAGAFALSGDRSTAFDLLPASVQPQEAERETGGTFSSSVRDNAIVLLVLADIAPDNAGIPVLVEYLGSRARAGRWGTTQENAWAFLALGKIMSAVAGGTYQGAITVDGERRADLEAETYTLAGDDLGGREIAISISGDGRAYYYWEARGIPVGQTFDEADRGLSVRRRFLDAGGRQLRPDSLAHGTMVIVELTISAPSQAVQNVVINDMLPAGIEIENPRLESRAVLGWLPASTLSPEYMDIRDDRLLLFVDLPLRREQKFFYAARAVTAGEFILPPVVAECMYDASLRSLASSGHVNVIRP